MTRATILIIGPPCRESQLFAARLEQEHFTAVAVGEGKAIDWLKANSAQAVLFTDLCPRRSVARIIAWTSHHYPTRRLPAILLTSDDPPEHLRAIPGLGETLRLHIITLKTAMTRLQRAIHLSQLARRLS